MKQAEKIPAPPLENPRPHGGWLSMLLDFRFESMMSPSLLKIVYALSLVMVAMGTLTWVFGSQGFGSFVWRLITSPVILVLGFLLTRLVIELAIGFFKLLETQQKIEQHLREQSLRNPKDIEL